MGRTLLSGASVSTQADLVEYCGVVAQILGASSLLSVMSMPRNYQQQRRRVHNALGQCDEVFFPFLRKVIRAARTAEGREHWDDGGQAEVEIMMIDAMQIDGARAGRTPWQNLASAQPPPARAIHL